MKYEGSTFWHNVSMFPNCHITTNNSSIYFFSTNQSKKIIGIPCKNIYDCDKLDFEDMYIFDVTEEISDSKYTINGNNISFQDQKTVDYIKEFGQSIDCFKKAVIADSNNIYNNLRTIKRYDANATPTPMKNAYSVIRCEEVYDSANNCHCVINNRQDNILVRFNSGVCSERFMNILRTMIQNIIDIYNSIK